MPYLNDNRLIVVGGNIRKWRSLKGLKQETLANELEISKVAVSKIENGKTDIPLKRLFAIATALQIGVHHLFFDPCQFVQNQMYVTEMNGNKTPTK